VFSDIGSIKAGEERLARRAIGAFCPRGRHGCIGGDEFVIILSGLTKATNASPIAEKILREIGRPVALDFETLVPSGSVGISVFPDDGQSLENLLAAADAAMYNAKRNPARAFAFYTPDITAR
jgi:diguanylate cyclase (GGDEF)-like protein